MRTITYFEELTSIDLTSIEGGHQGVAYKLGELVGGIFGVVDKTVKYLQYLV